MRTELYRILLPILLLLAVSCGKEQGPDTPPAATTEVTVFLSQTDGQEVRIIVSASGEWSISSDVDWAAVYPLSGGAGENTIVVRTMESNPDVRERVSYFDMTVSGGQPQRYWLVQEGVKGVEVISPLSVIDSKDGGRVSVKVLANTEFSVETGVSWASLAGIQYGQDSILLEDGVSYSELQTAVLDIEVQAYDGTVSRKADVSIMTDDGKQTVTLIQSVVQWDSQFYKKSLAANTAIMRGMNSTGKEPELLMSFLQRISEQVLHIQSLTKSLECSLTDMI